MSAFWQRFTESKNVMQDSFYRHLWCKNFLFYEDGSVLLKVKKSDARQFLETPLAQKPFILWRYPSVQKTYFDF